VKRQFPVALPFIPSGPLRGWRMSILDKLNITEEITDHERLKIVKLLGNEEFNEQILKYSALLAEVYTLAEQLENDKVEDIQRTLNEKQKLLSYLRRSISDKFDIDLLILEDEVFPVHASHPVSCFSLPERMKILVQNPYGEEIILNGKNGREYLKLGLGGNNKKWDK